MRHIIYKYALYATTAYDECTGRPSRCDIKIVPNFFRLFSSSSFIEIGAENGIKRQQHDKTHSESSIRCLCDSKTKEIIFQNRWFSQVAQKTVRKGFIELGGNQFQVFNFYAAVRYIFFLPSPTKRRQKLMKHLHKPIWPTESWSGKYQQYIFNERRLDWSYKIYIHLYLTLCRYYTKMLNFYLVTRNIFALLFDGTRLGWPRCALWHRLRRI